MGFTPACGPPTLSLSLPDIQTPTATSDANNARYAKAKINEQVKTEQIAVGKIAAHAAWPIEHNSHRQKTLTMIPASNRGNLAVELDPTPAKRQMAGLNVTVKNSI